MAQVKKKRASFAPLLQHAELRLLEVRPEDVGEKYLVLGARDDDKVLNRTTISSRVSEYAENLDVVVRDGTTIELIENGDGTYSIVDGQNRLHAVKKAGIPVSFMAFVYPRRLILKPSHPFTWQFILSRMVSGRNAARTTLMQMLRMYANESPWYASAPDLAPEIAFALERGEKLRLQKVRVQYKVLVQAYVNKLYFAERFDERGEPPRAPLSSSNTIVGAWTGTSFEEILKTVAALRWWEKHCLRHRTAKIQNLLLTVRGLTLMLLFYEKYGDTPATQRVAKRFSTYETDILMDRLHLHRNSTHQYIYNWMGVVNYKRKDSAEGGLYSLFDVTGRESRGTGF